MILVDTSIIMDFLRAPTDELLGVFEKEGAGICGVTKSEVLHGARSADHLIILSSALDDFSYVEMQERVWTALGRNLYRLRSSGVTVPFADAIIATIAIENDLELLASDKHFELLRTVLPNLKLRLTP